MREYVYVAHSLPLFLSILDLCPSVQQTNHILIYLTLSSFFFLSLCLSLYLSPSLSLLLSLSIYLSTSLSQFLLLLLSPSLPLSFSIPFSPSLSHFHSPSLSSLTLLSLSPSPSPSLCISRPDTWQFSNKEEMDPDNSCYVRCSATDHYKGTSLEASFIILFSFLSIFIMCP